MIIFETEYIGMFNYIIHRFLLLEIFDYEENIENVNNSFIGDKIEFLLPKYLFREQYMKCISIVKDLFYWTEDDFYHTMSAFHELVLYRFINYVAQLRENDDEFDSIYFDEKCNQYIDEVARKELVYQSDFAENADEFQTLEEIKDSYYDVFYYPDSLFSDLDFEMIPSLYNRRINRDTSLEKHLGINMDFYFEILPLDIQEQYKTQHMTLTGEVSGFLDYIEYRIHHGSLYKLFWINENPVNEDRIQLILDNMMDAYFYNQAIDITREALLGNGEVDFKLYRNKHQDEKVLIEVKKASNPHFKKGYEKQLVEYMLSSKYSNAFYLVCCFTDAEYEKIMKFIREHIYTDTMQMYINISILDVRKRKTASIS